MKIKTLTLAAAITVGLVGAAEARDQIRVVGSSTVFPFSTAVAEQFGKSTRFSTPVVESTGTGGGMKLFCSGVGEDHPDVTNASRRMKKSEFEACTTNGIDITEVKVGFEILKSLKLRANGINFIACPSCSRQNFDVISTMNTLESRLDDIRTPMDVAVIGCIVNGPGEAREADVGLTGATPSNLIYIGGEPDHKVSNQDFVDHLESVIRERAEIIEAKRAEREANIISSTH